ncbi:MAG: 50S ribosomal protein L9 [Candidatus Marinimicrobia bacterium]|jgi:large subunit ribosomal protein L9|nr:50S ribosomal protein L9 [Candidatus Neomarinimicrobiota bacterium]|tara:strand:- start:1283 stop:1729 length:447 start_codon:yes stop_codon:yes gene_type:complete
MDVILLKDVDNLGTAGDVVKVKPGFARNFLVPRGLALRASKQNLAVAEERKRVIRNRAGRAQKVYINLGNSITKTELTIEVQVGEEERMFGSVTSQDIQQALSDKGITVDRHAIQLEEPIKALGVYNVPVKVTPDLIPELKLYVIKTI